MNNPLDNIRIVLVEPTGRLNVGQVARAMKNFGVGHLTIVGDIDPDHLECRKMASGAQDVLDATTVVPTLEEALADVEIVLGSTARRRHRVPTVTPREAAQKLVRAGHDGHQVAILFGREDHGLSTAELALCHEVISIPTSPERASINIAQAAMLVTYELFQASEKECVTANADVGRLTSGDEWRRLYEETCSCFDNIGYTHDGNRRAVRESVVRFLKLGPLQTRDARHLFGLVRRIDDLLKKGRIRSSRD